MSSTNSNPAILLESSFLVGTSHRNPHFLKLLELAKQNNVDVFISKISFDEWRTNKKFKLIELIRQIEGHIDELNQEWAVSIITQNAQAIIDKRFLPDVDELEKRSKEEITRFCEENSIKILPFTYEHMVEALEKYFLGLPPFRSVKHRPDLPDSWIFVAALELKKEHSALHCLLGKDEKNKGDQILGKALKNEGCLVHADINELIKIIVPVEATIEQASSTSQPDLAHSLSELVEKEKEIKAAVLGYVVWFDPIPKQDLFNFMNTKGYSSLSVTSSAQQLIQAGYLKDTGNHYVANTSEYPGILEEAKTAIMGEVLQLLNKRQG